MPKIDPVTGCKVMTTAEFWAAEAEKEGQGRSGGELMGDFMDEMEKDRVQEQERLRQPDVALQEVVRAVKDWNEADPDVEQLPTPLQVLEVKDCQYSTSFRGSSFKLSVRCSTTDGRAGTFTIDSWQTGGSMMEPPDGEETVSFEVG
jgi:hypothetical protein